MKTKRIINLVVWAVVALVLIALVCVEWHRQGCGWQSLVMAAVWYTILPAALGFAVDGMLKGN